MCNWSTGGWNFRVADKFLAFRLVIIEDVLITHV